MNTPSASAALYYARTTVTALAASPSSPAPPPPPGLARAALAATAAFFLLDAAVTRWLPLEAWLAAISRGPARASGPKARAALAREVGIKVVGLVHLGVQLPLAAVALLSAPGRAALGGGPLLASLAPPAAAARLYAATPLTHAVVSISAGYFAWDVASLMPRAATAGPAMLAHGCLCAALYWYGALTGSLSFYGSLFVLWEASTPAVYARWLAAEAGWGGTAAYAGVGVGMILSFFLARVLGGAAASASFWASAAAELASPVHRPGALHPALLLGFRAANVGMTALNLWWFGRMVAGLARLVARARCGAAGAAAGAGVVLKEGGVRSGGGGGENVAPGVAPAGPAKAAGREE